MRIYWPPWHRVAGHPCDLLGTLNPMIPPRLLAHGDCFTFLTGHQSGSLRDLWVHDPADIVKLVLVSKSRYNGKESFAPGELRGLFSLNLLRQMWGV